MYYVIEVDMHFVHIWGIEFVLNIIVMHLVSLKFPVSEVFKIYDRKVVDMDPWRYAKPVSIILVITTLTIYFIFGSI